MKISCGILPYRIINGQIEVFLVHPGGPFFKNKDVGFWGISKGEVNKEEEFIDCAIREFKEETGIDLYGLKSQLIPLGEITLVNNKVVHCWAIQQDFKGIVDTSGFVDLRDVSNKIEIKLGIKFYESPEIDKGQFYDLSSAAQKMNPKQSEFLERLVQKLK